MTTCAGCAVEKEFYASYDEIVAEAGPICALCEEKLCTGTLEKEAA